MEKIESALSQSESDLSCLAKAYETVRAEASSFLSLGLQWQEIEDRLDSTRTVLLTRFEELRVRESELGEREKEFEARAEQTNGIDNLEELKQGKSELESIRLLIRESNEELENRFKSFEEAGILLGNKHREVEEVEKLIREKEEECDSVENRVRETKKKLSKAERSVEKVSKEIECKEMELKKAKGRLNECCDEIEWKEKQLFDMEWDINKNKKEYHASVGKLKWAQKMEERCNRKLEMKRERVKSLQRSLEAYSDDIELKESRIKEVDVRVKEFGSHKKEMEEWSLKLEAKQKELEGLAEKLESTESCFEAFRPRLEELHLIEERVGVCVDEVQLKLEKIFGSLEEKRQEEQKHFDGLEKSVQERSLELERKERRLNEQARGLELKERRLEEQESELELKEQEVNSILKAAEEHVKSKKKTDRFPCVVKVEQLEHNPANNSLLASNQLSINRDGRGLQLFMNEHLKRVDSVGREVSAHLQDSADPAGLVLEAMQGFYPTSFIKDNSEVDVDLRIIRRSCIILLQQLKSLSPKISYQVRDEAMKLAADWKTKMTVATENRLAVLGFLRLVTTYELTSTYDAEELQSLLAVVSKPEQAADMFQSLGIKDKAPGTNIMSSLVKIEEPGSSLDVNTTTIPPPKISSQNDMLASLLSMSNPAEHVLCSVHDSFAQYWTTGDVSFKEGVMLSNIVLLQCLIIVSPHIGRHLKKYAKRLADRWRAEMKGNTENAFDILGFLLFTSAYELASRIKIDETIQIFELISQKTWALKKCQTYGFPDKNADDFIRNLIKKKQLIQAVGFIRTFKLVKYQPVPLLKEYVDAARKGSLTVCSLEIPLDEKIKLLDSEIADLRAVYQCVQHYHLESEYSPAYIEMEVVQVQNLKELLRRLVPSVGSKIVVNKQEQRKRKKVDSSSSICP